MQLGVSLEEATAGAVPPAPTSVDWTPSHTPQAGCCPLPRGRVADAQATPILLTSCPRGKHSPPETWGLPQLEENTTARSQS